MIPADLIQEWRSRATQLDRYAPVAAQAFRDAADELEAALDSSADTVSLRDAAKLGGYSVDHLQRLVRVGSIANVGRKGKPRIRRVDVPVKPGYTSRSVAAGLLDGPTGVSIRPTAVVASVIKRGA